MDPQSTFITFTNTAFPHCRLFLVIIIIQRKEREKTKVVFPPFTFPLVYVARFLEISQAWSLCYDLAAAWEMCAHGQQTIHRAD